MEMMMQNNEFDGDLISAVGYAFSEDEELEKIWGKPPKIQLTEKYNLTLEEAALYFNIGQKKLKEISNSDRCSFVLWCGNRRLFKRKELEKYISKSYSI